MENKNFIEQDLYNKFLENMPLVCCDLLIYHAGNYLLVRRNQEPCKGRLYFPGGRLFKHETLEQACLRIAKNECGLDCVVRKFLGVYETDFATGPNNIPVHTVNMTYFLHALNSDVKLDSTSSEYVWMNQNHIPEELSLKLKEFIEETLGNEF